MDTEFDFESYQYHLPADQIAQLPTEVRDKSRLFVLDNINDRMQDMNFTDILNFIEAGDLIVVNDTKVFPARLEGKKGTGGKIELFHAYRIQYNFARGPAKGGIRFHPHGTIGRHRRHLEGDRGSRRAQDRKNENESESTGATTQSEAVAGRSE